MDEEIRSFKLGFAAAVVWTRIRCISDHEFAQRIDEIDTCRLILIAKNTGKGFEQGPETANFRQVFTQELKECFRRESRRCHGG